MCALPILKFCDPGFNSAHNFAGALLDRLLRLGSAHLVCSVRAARFNDFYRRSHFSFPLRQSLALSQREQQGNGKQVWTYCLDLLELTWFCLCFSFMSVNALRAPWDLNLGGQQEIDKSSKGRKEVPRLHVLNVCRLCHWSQQLEWKRIKDEVQKTWTYRTNR